MVGTAEFPRFMRLRIAERQEASLAREGKNTCRLRTLFYGAAARLGFRATKTHSCHRKRVPTAVQQLPERSIRDHLIL